jgi:hypothetical protein
MTMAGGGSETGGNPNQTVGERVIERLRDSDRWTGYDDGGVLPTGLVVAKNNTGAPEKVWTVDQLERAAAWIKAHYSTGGFTCPDSPANPDA